MPANVYFYCFAVDAGGISWDPQYRQGEQYAPHAAPLGNQSLAQCLVFLQNPCIPFRAAEPLLAFQGPVKSYKRSLARDRF